MKGLLRSTDAMALAVFVAMSLGACSLLELTRDTRYLLFAIPVIGLLMLISAVARRFSTHAGLVLLWQVLALVGATIGLGVSATPGGGNLLAQVRSAILDGVLHIQTQAAPMEPNAGTTVILVLLVGLVTIIADVLVLSLTTPAWVIAPLLTLYLIPALALDDAVSWRSFVLLGVGFLVVLAASTATDLSSWTRSLRSDDAPRQRVASGVWSMAALVGIPVLALAVLLGAILPTFGTLDLSSSRPRGVGPIQMQDPTIQLNRNLAQQSENVALTYTSQNPDGEYLRLASLTVLDRDSWKLTPVQLREGDLPAPPGLTGAQREVRTTVSVRDFGSQYLPAPYAPKSFEAPGTWAFDPVSLMVLSTAQNNADSTRGLSYSVVSVATDPNPAEFASAEVGTPPDAAETATVPNDIPQEIIDLTAEVTRGASTPALKAAAIQAWLRDPRRFTYSTDAPSGDGYDVMRNFLLEDRAGYCVHFASAMAMMARITGIPSRVSIGFLPGTRNGDQWEVRGKDMHAWPELYFEGHGWVRYEPTAGVADAPNWTVVQGNIATPSGSAGGTPSETPSANPSASQEPSEASPTTTATQTVDIVDVGPGKRPFSCWRVFAGIGVGVLVLALLATPMLVRLGRRRRRFAGRGSAVDQVEGLWSEVRDTLRDVGASWPAGSPRAKASALAPSLTDESAEAMERVGAVVERSRYSRGLASVPDELARDVRYVTSDVRAHQGFGTKARALLLPPSVFSRRR